MKIVLQRVSSASVIIAHKVRCSIGQGLLILLGIADTDTEEDVEWLTKKIVAMRIFSDAAGLMNRSVTDVKGDLLVVSQFTLYASTKKGNRPSFIKAARPEKAIPLYEAFIARLAQEAGQPVAAGIFGADMQIALTNDGPVTIIVDSQNRE